MLVAAVGVMLLVGGVSGAVGFALTRAGDGGSFVSCGTLTCFDDVDQERIESDLTGRGFACGTATSFRDCAYQAVHRRYQVGFQTEQHRLSGVSASVTSTTGFPASEGDANFLVWVAGQVFAGDDGSMGRVEGWLRDQVRGYKSGGLQLNGYSFWFASVSESSLRLRISAVGQ